MKRKNFLMLMALMVIGLFSVAYSEAVSSMSVTQSAAAVDTQRATVAEAKIQDLASAPVIIAQAPPAPVPPAPPAPPALPTKGESVNWFKGGNWTVPFGQTITLVDIWTGKSFKAIRTYGHNHADMETATLADTQVMKQIFGGTWSWDRRPMVAIINGKNYAVSIAGMPHAGLEKAATQATVVSRSGGFGRGLNLDKIKGNGMDGHFDLHMLASKTHGTGRVDPRHQAMVRIAAGN